MVAPASGMFPALMSMMNIGASITDIYFDDDRILTGLGIESSDGVKFSPGSSPKELPEPGGAYPEFVTSVGLSADFNAQVSLNGVNSASDWLGIFFGLADGKTLDEVSAALTDGGLRVGRYVQPIGLSSKSNSFVNPPPEPVRIPKPCLTLLLSLGLASVSLIASRTE